MVMKWMERERVREREKSMLGEREGDEHYYIPSPLYVRVSL
jgi:hypothetical protein